MATNENLIPIPGRLHSVATEGHVAGADEIYDDNQERLQSDINEEALGKYSKPQDGIPVSDLAGVGSANGLASLDSSGKVPSGQLPSMDYIPTSEKGTASGVATLDSNGKVTSTQLPSLDYVPTSEKGANGGVATLGNDGKVPSSQLPSYVDDVIDLLGIAETAPEHCAEGDKYYNSTSKKIFTATGTDTWGGTGADPESGKIYITLDDNKEYRWSGTTMAEISESLALGETASTAFAGNRGVAIEGKIPSAASPSNQLVDNASMQSALSGKQDVLTFDDSPTASSNNPVKSGGVKTYVDTKNSELSTSVTSQLNTINSTVNTKLAAQDAAIAQYNGNDVIVGALPATGVANKIYRVPNDPTAGKYTDYMFKAGALTIPIKIGGPYDFPGIDKMPIENSDNVVESGGLYDYLEGWAKDDLTGSVTWTTGYALGLNGAATARDDGALSNFIPVTAGDVYLFNTTGLNDNTGILTVMGYSSDSESAAVVTALPFGSIGRFQEILFCLVIPSGITHIRIVTRYASGSIYSGFYLRRYREITNAIMRNMYIKPMLNPEGWFRDVATGTDGIKRFSISKIEDAKYICQPCKPGDRFTMKSTWHTSAVLAFYDSNLNILTAERKTTPYTGVVTAPEGAAWVTSMLNGTGDYMMKGADPMAGLCMKVCTQAEYDAMASHDSQTLYIIT